MAVRAQAVVKKSALTLEELRAGSGHGKPPNGSGKPPTVVDKPVAKANELTPIQVIAARMYAKGHSFPFIARKLADHIIKDETDRKKQLKRARATVRSWSHKVVFRDEVYANVLAQLDLETPAIARGITRKAKEGRVDAARLALELNGRHSPHTEEVPTQIIVAFTGIPRPDAIEATSVSDADAEVDEAEWDEA